MTERITTVGSTRGRNADSGSAFGTISLGARHDGTIIHITDRDA